MKRSGFTVVQGIVALAVVGLVAFAAVYFISAPNRTRIDEAFKNFAEWTPENIAKDPVNYLNFCEEETKKAILKLKASEIAIAQKKGLIENMLTENKNKVALGEKALTELKDLYRKADEAQQWPVSWNKTTMDQAQCKRQILKFAGEVKSKGSLVVKLDVAVEQLRAQTGKVQEARDNANEQLSHITTSREMLKVQQITADLTQNLISIKTAIQTSVLGVASTEPGSISLDDLAATKEATVDESEFSKIMGN